MAKQKSSGWLDKFDDNKVIQSDATRTKNTKNIGIKKGPDQPIGNMLDITLGAPQRQLVKMVTGKEQSPSEAMGIENPYGAFAADAILDPTNLVGAGLVGKAAKASKKTGILSKAYKINPFAIKENPEMYLYRAQPENFNTQNTIDFIRQELLANRSKPWYKSVINSYEEGHPSLVAQNDFHGRWYESNPERLDWYLHSGDKVDVGTPMEILRGKINKNSSSKFSIKNNPKANPVSLSPETEFVVPKNITESFEKFPESSWKKLIDEDKKFNTPHWLKGYKKENGGWLEKYNDGGPIQPNYNDSNASAGPGFQGDGYSNVGRNYSPAWGGQFKEGGKLSFIKDPKLRNMLEGYKPELLQTIDDYRLPEGYMAGSIYPSTEVSTSIGGEDGEPSYLIPSFKYGQPLQDPTEEFDMTGQYLGGPFKTWQDAEKFQEIRHQYVEKGQPLPSPIATSNMAMGGALPGATGHMYARYSGGGSMPGDVDFRYPRTGEIPDNGKYAKKTKASAQNGKEMKFYQEGLDFKPKSISKNGSELTKLDQLTNFTNYNTKQPGGWLDKYQ
jgi:hypothetical protein